MPAQFELGELDYALRGALFRHALGDSIGTMRAAGKSMEDVEKSIDDGLFTVLFDAGGKFIEQSFTLPSPEAPP